MHRGARGCAQDPSFSARRVEPIGYLVRARLRSDCPLSSHDRCLMFDPVSHALPSIERLCPHGDADEMAELCIAHPVDLFVARVQIEGMDDVDEPGATERAEVFLQDIEAARADLERIQHSAVSDLRWVCVSACGMRATLAAHVSHSGSPHEYRLCNDAATRRAED